MFLYLLVLISLINQSINAQCSSSYSAPYQLSTTKTLTVNSATFDGGKYYIQICGSVDVSYCPYSAGQQQCFATTTWEVVSDGLGDPTNTAWSPNGASDWSGGAIAENNDIAYDYDQCNADPSTNMFKVTYFCQNGDDSVAIVSEPSISKSDPCRFEFRVDSSVVCAHGGGGTSTGPTPGTSTGPTPGSSGQPDPEPEQGGSKKGLSGGWIFTIILIVVFTVYLFGGIAWNRMRKGLSGAEMIPNKDFWAGLPGLVKDGCIFFVQKCKGLCGRGGGSGGERSTAFM